MAECTIQELALKLRDGKGVGDNPPRFALFLGAGASIESGIPGTDGMLEVFKEKLTERWQLEGSKGTFKDWLAKRPTWKKNASEYSNLFTAYEPTERGRARHIQELMAQGKPGFGYFCLSQLLSQGYIDAIITTNFDDLVYEACALWTGVRPRVYSYGASSGPVRRETGRPSIIKLHGDFLYSSLKNTDAETAQQDPNMRAVVQRLQDEYEIIVLGCSGNDKSIMDLFESTPPDAGLYWCVHKDTKVTGRLRKIMDRSSSFTLRTEGFENLMDEFLHVVDFQLPVLERTVKEQAEAIVKMVSESTSKYKDQYLGQAREQVADDPFLSALLDAESAFAKGDYVTAIAAYRRSMEVQPDNPNVLTNLASALRFADQTEESLTLLRRAMEIAPDTPGIMANLSVLLRDLGQFPEALDLAQRSSQLWPGGLINRNNLGILFRLSGQDVDAQEVFTQVVNISEPRNSSESQMVSMLAFIGLDRGTDAISSCTALIASGTSAEYYMRAARRGLGILAKLGADGAQQCISIIDKELGEEQA